MRRESLFSVILSGLFFLCIIVFPSASFAETDVTDKILFNKGRLLYDRLTGENYFDVSLTNISSEVLLTPIKVVIDSVTPSTVTVANADGVTADGKPYFVYSVDGGQLVAGATTSLKRWSFLNPAVARFTYTNVVFGVIPDAVGQVGPSGGIIEVTDPASSIFGAKIFIPENALEDEEAISISYEDELPLFPGENATVVSKFFTLIKSGDSLFKHPVNVTIPFYSNEISDENIPSVFYWDSIANQYSEVEIIEINRQNGTITFRTIHFSGFVTMVAKSVISSLLPPADTGFKPELDGLEIVNFGPSGKCTAFPSYSKWYWDYKKLTDPESLYNKYEESVAKQIISRTYYIYEHTAWVDQLILAKPLMTDATTGILMISNMSINKSPQILMIKGWPKDDSKLKITGHAVLVYKYENGKFYIYDSNFPGKEVTVEWDMVNGFHNYRAPHPLYDDYYYDPYDWNFKVYYTTSLSSLVKPEYLEFIYKGADTEWTDAIYPHVEISSPEIDANDEYVIGGQISVDVTGDVNGGRYPADNLIYFVNGKQETTIPIIDSHFSFNLSNFSDYQTSVVIVPKRADDLSMAGFKEIFLLEGNAPPLAPVLNFPLNNAENLYSASLSISWDESHDPENDPIFYCVTIKQDSTPNDIPVYLGCDQDKFSANTSMDLGNDILEPGKKYWWAVWAKDSNDNWSTASEWWSFSTALDPNDIDDDGDGYTENQGDCNDDNVEMHPNTVWYRDTDGDGYYDGTTVTQCQRGFYYYLPSELSSMEIDCDDNNSSVNPGVLENCSDSIDNNCNGVINENCVVDSDNDGITDDVDQCAGTPAGEPVDATGCPAVGVHAPEITFAEYDDSRCWNYITWTDEGAAEYRVYWGTESGVTTGSELLTPTTTLEYGHTGVLPGSTYYYRVASVAADGVTESELSAEVSIYVSTQCQTPTVTSAGQVWMDRNLGASRVAISFDDEEAYGDLYQWGRGTDGHEKRNSDITSTLSSTDDPGHGDFIISSFTSDWKNPPNDNLWQGATGINNPCPAGFRVPTNTELQIELNSWNNSNSSAAFASPLKLVVGGYRMDYNGVLDDVGLGGRYWSSTVIYDDSRYLNFSTESGSAYTGGALWRANGLSVRCISDPPPELVQPPQNVQVSYDPVEEWNYITWDDVSGATAYHVYWGTETGVTEFSEELEPPTTSPYAHTGVLPGWTYCYVVTAEVDGVESDLSEDVCVTIPEENQTIDTVISETGQVWMDRNLGASRVAMSFDDEEAYGDLYQWGRGTDGHEKRNSPITSTLSSIDEPGHGNFITVNTYPGDWRSPENNNLWQGEAGINNPCPAGFRLPTDTELDAECAFWASQNYYGAFNSPLKLVAAGYRTNENSTVNNAGRVGLYWSSTVESPYARTLNFDSVKVEVDPLDIYPRAFGVSARCLED